MVILLIRRCKRGLLWFERQVLREGLLLLFEGSISVRCGGVSLAFDRVLSSSVCHDYEGIVYHNFFF